MYKLINKQTNQEHLCDKVTIDGFDYYVSDESIKQGSYWFDGTNIRKDYSLHLISEFDRKVIATNSPNIDIPKVVDEVERIVVELYPVELDDYDGKVKEYDINKPIREAYTEGYNKSKETHPFSEEDIVEFYKWVNQPHPEDKRQPTAVYINNIDMWWYNHKKYTSKEIIQLWKDRQPKIIYYE